MALAKIIRLLKWGIVVPLAFILWAQALFTFMGIIALLRLMGWL